MSKRNIAYIKPQDPKFLQQLKQQIGYKEGPTVETKRQKLEDRTGSGGESDCEERPEREDEKPQIVVLNSGDLTAEEVAAEEKRLEREAAEAPADLNQPIVFRKRHKPAKKDLALEAVLSSSSTNDTKSENKSKATKSSKSSKKSVSNNAVKLSFNPDEEEEEEDQ